MNESLRVNLWQSHHKDEWKWTNRPKLTPNTTPTHETQREKREKKKRYPFQSLAIVPSSYLRFGNDRPILMRLTTKANLWAKPASSWMDLNRDIRQKPDVHFFYFRFHFNFSFSLSRSAHKTQRSPLCSRLAVCLSSDQTGKVIVKAKLGEEAIQWFQWCLWMLLMIDWCLTLIFNEFIVVVGGEGEIAGGWWLMAIPDEVHLVEHLTAISQLKNWKFH